LARRIALATVALCGAAFFARARLSTVGGAIAGLPEKFVKRGSPEQSAKDFAKTHPPVKAVTPIKVVHPHTIPCVVDDVVIIASLVLIVAALLYAMFRAVDWAAIREWIGEAPADAVIPDQMTISPDEVRAAVERSSVAIDLDGDDRGAVIGSWLALEGAIGAASRERAASETSEDFTVRILTAHDLPVGELTTLHDCYRRARYSHAAVGPGERAAARRAIDAIERALVPATVAAQ
jgi:hypothetical protein